MADIDNVRTLLTEAATHEAQIASLLQVGDATFEIDTDSGVTITLDYDGGTGRLMLSADVGTPAANAREVIYDAMLNYGMLWRETGNVRLAVAGKSGQAVLMADLFAFALNPSAMAIVIVNFAEKAILWRGIVGAGAEAAETLLSSDFGMIRV